MILALETATKACSVSLVNECKLVAARSEFSDDFKHAERLHILVDALLEEQQLSFNDVTAIAVSRGPGSYTGLRIGVSSAKGFAYALGLSLYSFSPLQLMALQTIEEQNIPESSIVISMIDARRDEVYLQVFDGKGMAKEVVRNEIITPAFFQKYAGAFLVGDGADKFQTWEEASVCKIISDIKPQASFLANPNAELKQEDVAYFEPFYLKDFVTTTPKKVI